MSYAWVKNSFFTLTPILYSVIFWAGCPYTCKWLRAWLHLLLHLLTSVWSPWWQDKKRHAIKCIITLSTFKNCYYEALILYVSDGNHNLLKFMSRQFSFTFACIIHITRCQCSLTCIHNRSRAKTVELALKSKQGLTYRTCWRGHHWWSPSRPSTANSRLPTRVPDDLPSALPCLPTLSHRCP